MAVSFKVFNTGTTASMVNSGYNNGFVKGTEIYANIFNGLFKDVSLVTVGLLNAIIAKSGYDVSGVTFDNALSEADMITYCTNLLGGLSVASAGKWTTNRSFTIKDYNSGNTGMGTTVDGTANIVLKLPQNINCNASNAAKWTTARNFTIKDADESNAGTTVAVDGTSTITLKLPSTIKATLDGNASSATQATNATNATNATYAMYTDSSHTSKTIEQRLTDLGFKSPSSNRTISLVDEGSTLGTITIKSNSSESLTGTSRQGNRVILELDITFNPDTTGATAGKLFSGRTFTGTSTILSDYRPSTTYTFYVPSAEADYNMPLSQGVYVTHRIVMPVTITINRYGEVTAKIESANMPSLYNSRFSKCWAKTLHGIKVGYQANPIS